ncbi:Holin-like protein CidB [bioreactor metagenome]|jgi:predicted murein hydrolase (TIGR00659 family)|uniref:Holin-like protein CidB n=1 Tax=bioreactor metagenome TaxID=1076179 RepID=A0A644XMW3_9ZZZZ|nr:LrgB family protein [Sedimentibacter saalensis]MEA5096732.1 LrgB family protein [Sedimentibacter saalensis]
MKEVIGNSVYFGVALCLLSYIAGIWIKKKLKWAILNPLLVSIVIVIAVLLIFDINYESFNNGGKYVSYFLTPATVCLAIPLYQQLELLNKNFKAIMAGILAGVFTSLFTILVMSFLFKLNHEQYVTILPKSITTAIGIAVSTELGGIKTITVAAIVMTGILGNVMGEGLCRLFKITDPIAVGLSFGTSSHAIGTSRALELGEIQGAMSSLSIAISGLLTVVLAPIFASFL